eukprot:jgi/Tetstr1/444194/TSEL_032088.t1
MLTSTTAAPGRGAATGTQEGEGKDDAEDDLHDPWHVPYSDYDDDFESPSHTHGVSDHHFRPHPDTFAILNTPDIPPRWNIYSHPYPLDPPIHLYDINRQRPQPVPAPAQPLGLTSPTFPASAALASHVLHAEQGALRGDPPPTLPLHTAASILQLPTSLVITISFRRAMAHQHLRTPMDVNDITITELEHLRPVTIIIVSGPPCQPWSRAGSRLGWQDHRSLAFASVNGFIRFYLATQPTPGRYIVENVPGALDFPEILSSLGTGNIMRATACGSTTNRDALMWTNIAPHPDIQNYVNNINAIELTDPGPCAGPLPI